MTLLYYLLAMALIFIASVSCALVNRISGGGFVAEDGDGAWLGSVHLGLPGKPLYYTSPLIGLIAWIFNPWPVAIAIAAAFFLWRLLPWGRWIGMGHVAPTRYPSEFEFVIEYLFGPSAKMCMFVRMLFAVPGLLLVFYVAHGFHAPDIISAFMWAFWLWLAYVIGWGFQPSNGVEAAEGVAGSVWALFILGAAT